MAEGRMRVRHAASFGIAAAALFLFLSMPLRGFHHGSRVELEEDQTDFWKDEEGLWGVEGKAWEHSPDVMHAKASSSASAPTSPLKGTKLVVASEQHAPAARSKKVGEAQHSAAMPAVKPTTASSSKASKKPDASATGEVSAAAKKELRSEPVKKPLGDFSVPVEYKGVNVGSVFSKAWKAAFNAAYSSAYDSAMQNEEDKLWRQARQGERARKELDEIERQKENAPKLHPQSVLAATEGEGEESEEGEDEKKPITWDAVPLGAKTHLHKGPEYTNGEEHFGPLEVHCAAGNCENLERAGVNVDQWKGLMFGKVHRSVPWPGFDPSEDPVTRVAQNTRTGRFAKYYHGRDDSVSWGGGPDSQSWSDPTAYRLEKHGVKVDSDLAHGLYAGFPLPVWDKGQFDHKAGGGRSPFYSAEESLQSNRESDEALEQHGVVVNRMPVAKLGKPYAHADGIPDRLVKNPQLPVWREEGVVSDAEQPSTFLLRDNSGDLMNTPQWQENDQGVEVEGKPETELQGDLSKAGVLVDHWPGHLGDGTASTWCSKSSWDCTSTNPTLIK